MRLFRTTGTALFAAAAALASGACTFLTGVHPVSRVSVTVAPDIINIGQQAQAFGTAFDGNTSLTGTNNRYNITFTSRDPSIATVVEAGGLVTGKAYGSTYIVGENNGKRDSALVTVRPTQAVQIIFGIKTPTYRVGAQNVVSATGYDSLGRAVGDRGVTYTARSPSVLTVSTIGVVTPASVGTSWIVGSLDNGPGNKPAVDSVLATVTPVPVASVSITPNNDNNALPTVYVGQSLTFSATLLDSLNNTTTRPITWSTANAGTLLTIDPSSGKAVGIAPLPGGTTAVQASVDRVPNAPSPSTVYNYVTIAVLAPVDTVRVLNNNAAVTTVTTTAGSSLSLGLLPLDPAGNALLFEARPRNFTVTSSNPAVATVPANTNSGTALRVTAGTAGTATVTIQALDWTNKPQGKASTITVTVQ